MLAPLLLFDIDGTLVRKAGPQHRQALEVATRRVSGLEQATTARIPTQGMLDRKIVELMLLEAGARPRQIGAWMPEIVRLAPRIYRESCPELHGKVCPGAKPLLARLRRQGVRMGLVTGNLSRIAWHKMERAGLAHHLTYGAFSEYGQTRAELVALALGRARRRGWWRPGVPVALVGDHENDILAAQANEIPVFSVATGVSTREELAACNPTHLLEDLRAFPVHEWNSR